MKKKPKTVVVSVELPEYAIRRLRRVAKLARVTVNQAALVLIALEATKATETRK